MPVTRSSALKIILVATICIHDKYVTSLSSEPQNKTTLFQNIFRYSGKLFWKNIQNVAKSRHPFVWLPIVRE